MHAAIGPTSNRHSALGSFRAAHAHAFEAPAAAPPLGLPCSCRGTSACMHIPCPRRSSAGCTRCASTASQPRCPPLRERPRRRFGVFPLVVPCHCCRTVSRPNNGGGRTLRIGAAVAKTARAAPPAVAAVAFGHRSWPLHVQQHWKRLHGAWGRQPWLGAARMRPCQQLAFA